MQETGASLEFQNETREREKIEKLVISIHVL